MPRGATAASSAPRCGSHGTPRRRTSSRTDSYQDGDRLPGGLQAFRTPGPEWPHYSFLYEGDPGIVFCSDLLGGDAEGRLHFIDPAFHEDPAATRTSVEGLLDLQFGVLCLDHGAPVTDDPRAAIRALLEETA